LPWRYIRIPALMVAMLSIHDLRASNSVR